MFSEVIKIFQKDDDIIQFQDSVEGTTRFNKNSQERAREIQDTADLSWFTLPQGPRLVPYTTVRISTVKRSN